MDGYLTQKDGIAHSLTNFLMNVPILRHPQTLFIGLAADDDLSEHVLGRPPAQRRGAGPRQAPARGRRVCP